MFSPKNNKDITIIQESYDEGNTHSTSITEAHHVKLLQLPYEFFCVQLFDVINYKCNTHSNCYNKSVQVLCKVTLVIKELTNFYVQLFDVINLS